jgi:hypothetical protein
MNKFFKMALSRCLEQITRLMETVPYTSDVETTPANTA